MAKKQKTHRYALTLPDIGLTTSQINTLKKNFKNNIVETMGGPDALSRRDVVVVVVVVIITRDW